MKSISLICVLTWIAFAACSPTKNEEIPIVVSCEMNDSILTEKFYAALLEFISRNPLSFDNKLKGLSEIKANKSRFHFTKRVMLPLSQNDITYDFWMYIPCNGGCLPYNFLFIHNSSKIFLLPLTDDHIYWENSTKSESDSLKPAIFVSELNNFISTFEIKKESEIEGVLATIMEFRKYQKVNQEDLPKLNYVSLKLSNGKDFNVRCRQKIKENMIIAEKWVYENRLVYSNGINVLMFDNTKDNHWEMKSLNTECNKWITF